MKNLSKDNQPRGNILTKEAVSVLR